LWLAIAAAFACGCARLAAAPGTASEARVDTPAWLAVEVYGGLEPIASDPTPDRVELVVDLTDSMAAPPDQPLDAPAPPFLVIAQPDPSQRADVVAVGRAGDEAIPVPPGLMTLIVQLDPPETIGPFRLEPGSSARVRVLDAPGTQSPERTWRIERGNEAVGRAFPPPERLPTPRNP
jgi:hypothetical protein